jgi:hypothetical protein
MRLSLPNIHHYANKYNLYFYSAIVADKAILPAVLLPTRPVVQAVT